MTSINIAFSRSLLTEVLTDIRALTSAAERKDVWVYNFGKDNWEFHGPDGFYWHGKATNAYEAKAKGWQAWLKYLETDARRKSARNQAHDHRSGRAA